MTEPKNGHPIQYRDSWHVAGYSGHDRINLYILAETDYKVRDIALRLYPNLEIGQCYCEGRVIDPERNRDILED